MNEAATVDLQGKSSQEVTHPDDVHKIVRGFRLAVGRFLGDDGEYSLLDFGDGPIRVLSSKVIRVPDVGHMVGDEVMAKGDRATIIWINWNYTNKYHYYTVKKGNRVSNGWYLESDIQPVH